MFFFIVTILYIYVSSSNTLSKVMNFLEKIPSDILAQTSYKTHAYSRALLHIEAYIRDHPHQMKEHLRFLQVGGLCYRDKAEKVPSTVPVLVFRKIKQNYFL